MARTQLVGAFAAAKRLKVSPRTVQRVAKIHGIGLVISGRRIFTSDDISRLRQKIVGKSGNPNFIAGNDLWRKRKIVRK